MSAAAAVRTIGPSYSSVTGLSFFDQQTLYGQMQKAGHSVLFFNPSKYSNGSELRRSLEARDFQPLMFGDERIVEGVMVRVRGEQSPTECRQLFDAPQRHELPHFVYRTSIGPQGQASFTHEVVVKEGREVLESFEGSIEFVPGVAIARNYNSSLLALARKHEEKDPAFCELLLPGVDDPGSAHDLVTSNPARWGLIKFATSGSYLIEEYRLTGAANTVQDAFFCSRNWKPTAFTSSLTMPWKTKQMLAWNSFYCMNNLSVA